MPVVGKTEVRRAMRVLDRIERHLRTERTSVKAELAAYPSPITACDAQYNHLAEERRRVAGELVRLAELRREIQASPDADAVLRKFLAASPHLEQAAGITLEADAASTN